MGLRIALCLAVACVVLVPTALSLFVASPPARTWAVELSVALGYVALALFALQFASTGRIGRLATPFGMDGTMRLHRWLGCVAALFVLTHVVLILWLEPANWSYFDPRVNWPRALALPAGLLALALVVGLPFVRGRLGFDHGWWRLTHGVLALVVVAVGTAHVILVGHHTNQLWKQALWVVLALAAFGLLVELRLLRPRRMRRRPWRLVGVESAGGRTWTLRLRAEGHGGLCFRPGQFVWLTVAESPYDLEQHPFSMTSSADRPEELSFAIKELGDFTSTVGGLKPGSRAWIDGPYGSFELPRDPKQPIVWLAGGIGIAPFLSMLRTLADRGERRPLRLVYGAGSLKTLVYHRELEELFARTGGSYVPVLEEPPEDWQGERGRVDTALVDKLLTSEERAHARVYACGPGPMLDALERELGRLGIGPRRRWVEHFDVLT
jgi:predicted ferric reductase